MQSLYDQLLRALDDRRPFVLCRIVETRGSTPQKAGAAMLVFRDGSQAGTLGGGCVEAEVRRRALAAEEGDRVEIATFQLDSDYGWDDGLICGGRMKVLTDPVAHDSDAANHYRLLAERGRSGIGTTEIVLVDGERHGRDGSTSWLLDGAGEVVARLRDPGDPPDEVRNHLKPLDARPRAYFEKGAAFLPILPRCRLAIIGGGHVGKAVADLAYDLEFDVEILDDREEYVAEDRFPRATRRVAGELDATLAELSLDANAYCLIVTRGHHHDQRALRALIDRGARYVGLIGSRRKIRMIFDDLYAEGVSAESLRAVYAPLGVQIGSQTVPEIALSICAELVAHRNLGGVVPGRPDPIAFDADR